MRFRSWLRDWLLIDLILLGGGGALAIPFYVNAAASGSFAAGVALDTLWANISTNLLAVWLSVRIIDSIIRRRDRMIATRAGILETVESAIERSSWVLAGEDTIGDLFDLSYNLDLPLPETKTAFTDSEWQLVQEIAASLRQIFNRGRDLLGLLSVCGRTLGGATDPLMTRVAEEVNIAPTCDFANIVSLKRAVNAALERAETDEAREVLRGARELATAAQEFMRHRVKAGSDIRTLRNLIRSRS